MNITLIHGTNRRGSTYHITHQIIENLDPRIHPIITEYFVPQALPQACVGCYRCIYESETKCPHATSTLPIKQSMLEADLIVLTSPVYVFNVSGSMKSFLDHFGYQWMSHRPEKAMFSKLGLSVVTAAGAGLGSTQKTLKTNLQFWGIKQTFGFKHAVMSKSYDEIPEKIKDQLDKKVKRMAKSLSKAYLYPKKKPEFMTQLYFNVMRMGKKGHPEWNETDHKYWQINNLFKVKPWESDSTMIGL